MLAEMEKDAKGEQRASPRGVAVMNAYRFRVASIACLAAALGACAGPTATGNLPGPSSNEKRAPAHSSPAITNLIVVIQQDRSFDDIFAGFPSADAPTRGITSDGRYVRLKPVPLDQPACHITAPESQYFAIAYAGGKMDGWSRLDSKQPRCPYTRVSDSDRAPYWKLAKEYALADHAFSSTRYGNFIDQLYLVAGTTQLSRQTFVAGPPAGAVWGCNAASGSRTTILKRGRLERFEGPFPCFNFPTLAALLDGAGISWQYYYDAPASGGRNWNPYEAIKGVYDGSGWKNMRSPATAILSDISGGQLPTISMVLSPPKDSDAPGTGGGPKWVEAIVSTVKASRYWPHSAVVVVWAQEGGGNFYDNVPPPQLDPMGLGFRVPFIAISPYAKRGYVSHTQYEFGSILKFIEGNWGLPSLGGFATDQRANSIADMFQ